MLGGEQSGHIEAVGFEMYTSMLEEAVKEMKGESAEERPTTQLNLGIALRIDEDYIPEENQRLRLYKKIAGAQDEKAIADLRSEMEDRYGPLPDATVYLLDAASLRLDCERIGIAQIDRKRGELHIRFTRERRHRSAAPDAAGGAQRQARRTVHAAGCAQVSVGGHASRRSSARNPRLDSGACAGAGQRIGYPWLKRLTGSLANPQTVVIPSEVFTRAVSASSSEDHPVGESLK